MAHNFTIDRELCTSCGKCLAECGHHVNINGGKTIDPENPRCTRCYHCYTVCPNNAIRLCGAALPPEADGSIGEISEQNLLRFFAMRRSIRKYETRPVDTATLEMLIDAARYIPSGGNAHSYEFTIVQNGATRDTLMKKLVQIYEGRSRLLNSVILRNAAKPFVDKLTRGFLKDRGYRLRMKELLERVARGDDPFFYFAPAIVIIHSRASIPTPKEDCVLAGYNIALMAQAMGLGSCFVTLAQNAINASRDCKRILGLEPADNVNAVIVLGHPAVRHLRIAPKPPKKINWL